MSNKSTHCQLDCGDYIKDSKKTSLFYANAMGFLRVPYTRVLLVDENRHWEMSCTPKEDII